VTTALWIPFFEPSLPVSAPRWWGRAAIADWEAAGAQVQAKLAHSFFSPRSKPKAAQRFIFFINRIRHGEQPGVTFHSLLPIFEYLRVPFSGVHDDACLSFSFSSKEK